MVLRLFNDSIYAGNGRVIHYTGKNSHFGKNVGVGKQDDALIVYECFKFQIG